jgi:hypothetical protein
MSESQMASLDSASFSDEEELPPIKDLADPGNLAIGDRFKKRGRSVIEWKIDTIAHPPHLGPIVTFAEIDGTARLQVYLSDIFEKGFSRVESTSLAGRILFGQTPKPT